MSKNDPSGDIVSAVPANQNFKEVSSGLTRAEEWKAYLSGVVRNSKPKDNPVPYQFSDLKQK